MYERNPWKRLQRTLILTYTLTFGTKAEAHAAADKINEVHTRINGIDPVTGKRYDALDPELLLYVHACLVDSAILFEQLTVGALDDAGRQRFHEEQMLAAELCLVPRELIPPTWQGLSAWLADFEDRGELQVTDGARRVLDLFFDPPAGSRMAARAARGLAARLRHVAATASARCTACRSVALKRAAMRASFPADPRDASAAAAEVPVHRALHRVPDAAAGHRPGRRSRRGEEAGRHPPVGTGGARSWQTAAMTASLDVDGLLLDIDGVLVTSWQPLPGAIEAVETFAGPRGAVPADHEHDHPHPGGARRDPGRGGVLTRARRDRRRR